MSDGMSDDIIINQEAINGYCKCGRPNGISGFDGLSCIPCYNKEYERRFGRKEWLHGGEING